MPRFIKDPKDIDKTIAKARKLAASGKPVLINVHIGGSDFRKGSISI